MPDNTHTTPSSARQTNEQGQAAILLIFLMIGLIAMVGLAIDGGGLLFLERDVQNAVDNAVLAATYAKCTGGDVVHAAQRAAAKSGFVDGVDGVVVDVDPQPGSDYVNVRIQARKEKYFIAIVYEDDLVVSANGTGRCTPAQEVSSGGGGGDPVTVGVFAGAPPGCLSLNIDTNEVSLERDLVGMGDVVVNGDQNEYVVPSTFTVGGDYTPPPGWRKAINNGGGGPPTTGMDTSAYGTPQMWDIDIFDDSSPEFAFGGDPRYVNLDNYHPGNPQNTIQKIIASGKGYRNGNTLTINGESIFYSDGPITIKNVQLIANIATFVSRDTITMHLFDGSNVSKANGDLPLLFSAKGTNPPPGCTSTSGPIGIDFSVAGGSIVGPMYAPFSHLIFDSPVERGYNSCFVAFTIEFKGNQWNQVGECEVAFAGETTIIPPTIGIAE